MIISHKVPRLLLAGLTLALVSSSLSLNAMKRKREDDAKQNEQERPLKKQKTERICTIVCNDGIKVQESYQVLSLSQTLKTIFNLITSDSDACIESEITLNEIDSQMMKIMIKYMAEIIKYSSLNQTDPEIIANLVLDLNNRIKKAPHYYTLETLINYAQASDYLCIKPLSQALVIVICEQYNLKEKIGCINCPKPIDINPALAPCIMDSYLLLFHKQLDPNNPTEITIDNLVDYNLLPDLSKFDDLGQYITHLITTSQFDTLQTTLATLCKYSGPLSMQAYKALFYYIDTLPDENNIQAHIINLITTSQFDALQTTLDLLCHYKIPRAKAAYNALIAYLKTLTKQEIQDLFDKQQGKSTLKMALELVHAQVHGTNLDNNLDCVDFFLNLNFWINEPPAANFNAPRQTEVLSQENLQHTLALIEPLSGVPVTQLDLRNYNLTSIPASIGLLVNLIVLTLSENKLTEIPTIICSLVTLRNLSFDNNKLTVLPDTIGELINLKALLLYNNQLVKLPTTIGKLVKLEYINVSNNYLIEIPVTIGYLKSIQVLAMCSNELVDLPDTIHHLFLTLRLFYFSNNKIPFLKKFTLLMKYNIALKKRGLKLRLEELL